MQFVSRHEVMQGGSRDALGSHPCQVPGLDYADGARLLPTTNPEDPSWYERRCIVPVQPERESERSALV